jgi:hypothetical protein
MRKHPKNSLNNLDKLLRTKLKVPRKVILNVARCNGLGKELQLKCSALHNTSRSVTYFQTEGGQNRAYYMYLGVLD